MLMVASTLRVAPSEGARLEEKLRSRLGRVDAHDGFLRLRLLRRKGAAGEYLFVTEWRDLASFAAYLKSDDFAASQDRIPDDLAQAISTEPPALFEDVLDSKRGD